jgi:hypothetical protein
MHRITALVSLGAVVMGCSGSDDKVAPKEGEGLKETADGLVFSTGEFEVPAGKESFLCYAKTLEHDISIDSYFFASRPSIHHVVFARTLAPEPDGFSECDVLFRPTWSPLLITTTADTTLDIPEGAANVLPAGTQLLMQLHLLNGGDQPTKDRAVIEMQRASIDNPRPAGIYAFGTFEIALPPRVTSTVQATCVPEAPVKLFAMLPHMHYLGAKLSVEMGPEGGPFESVWQRDPYDFNDQSVDLLDIEIPAGHTTRTTCTYENSTDETITFGESSFNEMCFAIGFALDVDGADGCIQSSGTGEEHPRDPAAGECADMVPNQLGIGTPCTAGGNECTNGLSCSADLQSTADNQGMCVRLGCTDAADCGGGSAACCNMGLTDLCIPEACRPLTCAPK